LLYVKGLSWERGLPRRLAWRFPYLRGLRGPGHRVNRAWYLTRLSLVHSMVSSVRVPVSCYIGVVLATEDRVGAGRPVFFYVRGRSYGSQGPRSRLTVSLLRGLSLVHGHLCNAVGDVPYVKRPRRSRPSPCPAFPYIKGAGSFIHSDLCDAAVDDIFLRQEAATGPGRRVNRARSPPT